MRITSVNSIIFCAAKIADIPHDKRFAGECKKLEEVELKEGYTAFIGGQGYLPKLGIAPHNFLYNKEGEIVAIDEFDEKKITEKINYVMLSEDDVITGALIGAHKHGGFRVSFHDSPKEDIRFLLKKLSERGIGGVLATMLPGTPEHMRKQIKVLANIMDNPDKGAAKMIGIYLEGPFMNSAKKGIHSEDKLLLPTIENWHKICPEEYEKYIKVVMIPPELDEGFALTHYLQERGIIVTAGHSMASKKQFEKSGIKQVTHFLNAMAPLEHQEEALTMANAALSDDEVMIEVIADESHIAPSMMDIIMKVKPKDKIMLVSDALPYAGTEEDFEMNGKRIYFDKEKLVGRNGDTLAGNMKFIPETAKFLIRDTNMTLQDFIRMTNENIAKYYGVLKDFVLQIGNEPNFVIWDRKKLTIKRTFIA